MTRIGNEIKALRSEIPVGVKLVAVSKFHPVSAIYEAYNAGQRLFGESRVQELMAKISELPNDIQWHFIGHLQTNKIKHLIGKTAMIESVDSQKLLDLIDEESCKVGVITKVLLQVHVAQEDTKFGFMPDELRDYFRLKHYENLKNTHICGIMGMASNTDDEVRIRSDFREIAKLFTEIKTEISPALRGFDQISMGMSGDWKLAIEEGSTMVRIGSQIFGSRLYK